MISLGGRSFLATSSTVIQMSTDQVQTSPLAIYHLPCNVLFTGMTTGLGYCPDHISVSVPLSSAVSLEFVPWVSATNNLTKLTLNHPTFNIPEPESFNKTVLRDLDTTLATLDGQFTASEAATTQQIETTQADAILTTSDYMSYLALALSVINGLCFIITYCISHRNNGRQNNPVDTPRCVCGKPPVQKTTRDPTPL